MTDYLALIVVIALFVGGVRLFRWLGRILTPLWATCRCGKVACTTCGRGK